MLKPQPEWQRAGFTMPSSTQKPPDLHSVRLAKSRRSPIAGSSRSIDGIRKTKPCRMTPEFAAMALVGGHADIVKTVIWDIKDPGEKAFYVMKLSEEYGRLLKDAKLADRIIRRLM